MHSDQTQANIRKNAKAVSLDSVLGQLFGFFFLGFFTFYIKEADST